MEAPLQWTSGRAKSNGPAVASRPQASSTSIRFWAVSKLVIRKDRISPARRPVAFDSGAGPRFPFLAGIARSAEKSTLAKTAASPADFFVALPHLANPTPPTPALA